MWENLQSKGLVYSINKRQKRKKGVHIIDKNKIKIHKEDLRDVPTSGKG